MPRISPGWTWKLMSWKWPCRVRPLTSRSGGPLRSITWRAGRRALAVSPNIISTMRSGVASAMSIDPAKLPSRRTVQVSAIWNSSFIRWVMYRIVTPRSRRRRTRVKRRSTSRVARAEVGSSSSRIEGLKDIALAISTTCCWPTERVETVAWVSRSRPISCRSVAASRCIRAQSITRTPKAAGHRQAAEEDVLTDRQRGDQRQFLVDRDNAGPEGIVRRGEGGVGCR